jgi:hypothetical protein
MRTFAHSRWAERAGFFRGRGEMPVRVKSHIRRRRDEDDPAEVQEARVVVYTPGQPAALPRKLTIREKLRRDLAIPKKKPRRKKTHMDDFAADADKLASTLERMEDTND